MNIYENPSLYTRIYWLIQNEKLEADLLFQFLELYWPTFIEKDSYVFLKEQFTDEQYNHLINRQINPEYWINLLTVDDFFTATIDQEKKALAFATQLIEIWQVKLSKEFPTKNFIVKPLSDRESGDYGLTFYQVNDSIKADH